LDDISTGALVAADETVGPGVSEVFRARVGVGVWAGSDFSVGSSVYVGDGAVVGKLVRVAADVAVEARESSGFDVQVAWLLPHATAQQSTIERTRIRAEVLTQSSFHHTLMLCRQPMPCPEWTG
jgi:hypothetical protein